MIFGQLYAGIHGRLYERPADALIAGHDIARIGSGSRRDRISVLEFFARSRGLEFGINVDGNVGTFLDVFNVVLTLFVFLFEFSLLVAFNFCLSLLLGDFCIQIIVSGIDTIFIGKFLLVLVMIRFCGFLGTLCSIFRFGFLGNPRFPLIIFSLRVDRFLGNGIVLTD